MVTADLRESGCERGGRAAILVQYESIFIEIALLMSAGVPRLYQLTDSLVLDGALELGVLYVLVPVTV